MNTYALVLYILTAVAIVAAMLQRKVDPQRFLIALAAVAFIAAIIVNHVVTGHIVTVH